MKGRLTTHVLDTGQGCPASGMQVDLYHEAEDGSRMYLKSAVTNGDGRLDEALLQDNEMKAGVYELVFHAGRYYQALGSVLATALIWELIPIRFMVHRPEEHHHIPLLIAPGGYSTYRGS